jgi:hypothetical protein
MRRLLVLFVVSTALSSCASSAVAVAPAQSSTAPASRVAALLPALSQRGWDAIADVQWADSVYTAATGQPVDVSVSAAYPADQPLGQRWADFFASLPHGRELARLKAFVAPLAEVQRICGGGAVGCYGDDRLIVTNETVLGFAPEEIARHEYGHHVARNRSNAPWSALDWGPKRWATAADVCHRVRWNTAYPGDESLLYKLNPGEAFAEAYRVLVDTKLGNAATWPLVDRSFYPDQAALDAVEQDVVSPWTGPTAQFLRVHFVRGARSVWTHRLWTRLDGTLRIVAPPLKGVVAVVGDAGRPLLATDRSSRRRTVVDYEVCGERSVTIRLTEPAGGARALQLRVIVP